jgi:protein-S-isoprenylcysteine O-methyltransferase Ste14
MADGQDYFIILLVLSVLLNFIFPVPVFLSPPATYSGFLIMGFGLVLVLKSRSLFLKNATTLQPSEEPTVLVTSGPFRISRNPIYLGMASILLGVAVVQGTLVALAFPIIFVTLIEFFIIPGEERMLEKIFGERYRVYKKSVRRWI